MNKKLFQALLLAGILLPGALMTAVRYREIDRELTASEVLRRQSIADLSAAVLQEKFNHLKSLAWSLSTRVQFREKVARGEWEAAIGVMRNIPRTEFPVIDRIFLTDPDGVLMADTPAAAGVRGRSFADRDWFRSVKAVSGPIVSEIYQRAAEPRWNVVAVAAPIHAPGSSGPSSDSPVLGYLVAQVRLSTLFELARSIDGGTSGRTYFADKSGRVAGWRSDDLDTHAVYDGSAIPTVQDALSGKRSVRVAADPVDGKEYVVAFSPVSTDRWASFLVQSKEEAFLVRARILRSFWAFSSIFILFNLLLAFLIIRLQNALLRHQKERAFHDAEREQLELFAFVASHDLQEPINKILSFGGILGETAREKLDPASCEVLDRMLAAAHRLNRILEDVRSFSTIREATSRSAVDLNAVLREVLAGFGEQLRAIGAEAAVSVLPTVRANPAQMRMLFENLVSNAVKYRKKDTPLRISIDAAPAGRGRVRVTVRDNGIGFDEKYGGQIFEPFKRLHRQSEYPGTGLGLTICLRVVALHGGRITARSLGREGSEFSLTLPVR